MKHLIIKYHDGSVPIVHFEAVPGTVDGYTLCGHDTDGDSHLGWEPAKQTPKKVTCEKCQRIVEECKKVKTDEISNISR